MIPFSILLFFTDPLILNNEQGFLLNFGILDEPSCYVRQCSLVLEIVFYFFKCLGLNMHFISLYVALSLHNYSSSGSLVFACLGRIN